MLGVFAIAASLLLLDKMLRLFDFVAVEGGPVGVVFKMLGALIGWMYYKVAIVPGGQPIGALETAFDKAGKRIRRLFGWRRPRTPDLAPAE